MIDLAKMGGGEGEGEVGCMYGRRGRKNESFGTFDVSTEGR